MAITLDEDIVPLTEAAQFIPRRNGRKPHVSCLYRWTVQGCRGVVLESIQCGATRCTSRQAIVRFFERLTAAAGLQQKDPSPTPGNDLRVKEIEARLSAEGL